MNTEAQVLCPYCGESITVFLDCSEDNQVYTEDCSVCCRPMLVHLSASNGELISVDVNREN